MAKGSGKGALRTRRQLPVEPSVGQPAQSALGPLGVEAPTHDRSPLLSL
jgi:hypothetical protein